MKRRKNRMTSSDEGGPARYQITDPCQDCPFARSAIPGWLGSSPTNPGELCKPEEYLSVVHDDVPIACHVHLNVQCAGVAIYRSNVDKVPPGNNGPIVVLPTDKENVFATEAEFLEHHGKFWKR